jgi:hypothetical protein
MISLPGRQSGGENRSNKKAAGSEGALLASQKTAPGYTLPQPPLIVQKRTTHVLQNRTFLVASYGQSELAQISGEISLHVTPTY